MLQRVKNLLIAVNAIGEDKELDPGMSLRDDLRVDSLAMVRLVQAIRKEFGFQVRAREMNPQNFGTVGSLLKFIESRLVD